MVRKHYHNYRYSVNVLQIKSRGFDRAQYQFVIFKGTLMQILKSPYMF